MSIVNLILSNLLGAVQELSRWSSFVRWILRLLALSHTFESAEWPENYHLQDGEKFDFIVVGSGSGGGVVSARLSEVPHWRVLVIEAGGDPPPASVAPSLFTILPHTDCDWDYKGVLDPGIGQSHPNGIVYMTRGKILGGSSSINYEMYTRGVPQDYDHWNTVAPGWDWKNVLSYFKKSENMTDDVVMKSKPHAFLHSTEGPIKITRATNEYFGDTYDKILNSYQELGIKRVLENNGPTTLGISLSHFTFEKGKRSSTAEAYLKPASCRPNLLVSKHTRVLKILINEITMKAYGVQVLLQSGQIVNVLADIEVIISAGTFDTAKLLMLSGVGPKQELSKHDINLIADLPVGENFQEHIMLPVIIKGKSGLGTFTKNIGILKQLDSFPVAVPNGFFKIDHSVHRPQFQMFHVRLGAAVSPVLFLLCQTIMNFDYRACSSVARANLFHEVDFIALILLHPLSRGKVSLKSKNYLDDPVIELGYYRNINDLKLMVKGLKFVANLTNTSYYKEANAEMVRLDIEACKDMKWDSDQFWECYAKNGVTSMLHGVGSCRMGFDGVVNEHLKVHHIANLRIVDASIMPEITSGNTNMPTIMIGEKAADMIKLEHNIIQPPPKSTNG